MNRGDLEPTVPGGRDDAFPDRVLGPALQRRRQLENAVLAVFSVERINLRDLERSIGQGAGLVKHDGGNLPGVLEGGPVADQQAVLRGLGGGLRYDQRNRQPQGVGTGDDHHRGHPGDRELEIPTHQEPRHQRHDADRDRHDREPERGTVRERLRPGLCGLCLLHHRDHLGQVGVLAGSFDLELHGSVAVDRPADELVADLFPDGSGLAGEHRFVNVTGPVGDHAVGGDLLSRFDHDDVAVGNLGELDVLDTGVGFSVGGTGHELREFLERRRGADHRRHLDPVSGEHDRDERCQFPVKRGALETEGDRGAVGVGHRDRHGDECHHPGIAVGEFIAHAGEKRLAAVEKDHRRYAEDNVAVAGKTEREAEKLLDQ